MNLNDSIKLLRMAQAFEEQFSTDGVFIAVLVKGRVTFACTRVPEKLRASIHETTAESIVDKNTVKILNDSGDLSSPAQVA